VFFPEAGIPMTTNIFIKSSKVRFIPRYLRALPATFLQGRLKDYLIASFYEFINHNIAGDHCFIYL